MAVRLFIFSLLIVSSSLLMMTTMMKQPTTKIDKIEQPIVTFIDSTMYKIDAKNVSQIIQSKNAFHYKTRDELHNATIILRSQNKNKTNSTDTISGQYILQVGDQLTFKDNVILNRDNELLLSTAFLEYNTKTHIGQNKHKFKLDYQNNTLVGNILYFDGTNGIIQANNAKFKLNIKERTKR